MRIFWVNKKILISWSLSSQLLRSWQGLKGLIVILNSWRSKCAGSEWDECIRSCQVFECWEQSKFQVSPQLESYPAKNKVLLSCKVQIQVLKWWGVSLESVDTCQIPFPHHWVSIIPFLIFSSFSLPTFTFLSQDNASFYSVYYLWRRWYSSKILNLK